MAVLRQAVLAFNEGAATTVTPVVRGGKGAGLAEMAELALPVPPGFTITSGVSRAFMQTGRLPKRVHGQLERGIAALEKQTGRQFGDPTYPLLVSVRSGAAVSMPGMMDTVLNVGLDPDDVSGLLCLGDKRFSRDTRRRFVAQWKEMFGNEQPPEAWTQLYWAIGAVLASWNSAHAIAYRRQYSIPDWWGTAVTVQAMVFGNLDNQSCTGVIFSADVATGKEGLYGEFLPKAQGEDVVSGVHTPRPIAELWGWNEAIYLELERYVRKLADHFGDVVDVEFTVEKGVLYILQCRRAKRSPLADVTLAVRKVWAKRLTKAEAVTSVSPSVVRQLEQPSFSDEVLQRANDQILINGLPASPGAAMGEAVFTSQRACELAALGQQVILVREDTSPEDLPGMLAASAIVTANGGATCHAAVVARELGIPAVVGVRHLPLTGMLAVDGTNGYVYRGPLPLSVVEPTKEVALFLRWRKQQYVPQIDFKSIKRRVSANRLLNDFYLTELMVELSSQTALDRSARELRNTTHRQIAECFAAYLLLAIGGEARHSNGLQVTPAVARLDRLTRVPWLHTRRREDAQQIIRDAACVATPATQIELVSLMTTLFAKGVWSDAFGGPRWATIAETLSLFLQGKLTPTVFVDRVFDLRHNGDCLFDKHPMVTALTNERALAEQLELKKRRLPPHDLYRMLGFHAVPGYSTEVEALWRKGVRQRIW